MERPNYSKIYNNLLALRERVSNEVLFPTLDPRAGRLIKENPFAFCVGVCLDRGTKADVIWTIPFWIMQQVGHFEPKRFYKMSFEEIQNEFNKLPKKPRYLNAAPVTFQNITRIVVEEFQCQAEKIWHHRRAAEVRRTFLSVYGVGPGIANMAVLLIESAFDLTFSDLDHVHMDIKPDVHTTLVLYRLGLAHQIDKNEAILAARQLSPSYPGKIDGALWFIGREFCHPTDADCVRCPLENVCPKVEVTGGSIWS